MGAAGSASFCGSARTGNRPEKPEPAAAAPAPENNASDALPSAFMDGCGSDRRRLVRRPFAGAPRWRAWRWLAAAQLVVIVLLFVYPGFLCIAPAGLRLPPQQDSSPLALRVEHSGENSC